MTLPNEALGFLARNKKDSGSVVILKRKSSSVEPPREFAMSGARVRDDASRVHYGTLLSAELR